MYSSLPQPEPITQAYLHLITQNVTYAKRREEGREEITGKNMHATVCDASGSLMFTR